MGKQTVKLAYISGIGFAPSSVWFEQDNRYFGTAGVISFLPAGNEDAGPKLQQIQDATEATMVRDAARKLISPANRTPTFVEDVFLFDSVVGRYLPDRPVLIQDGTVKAVGHEPFHKVEARTAQAAIMEHGALVHAQLSHAVLPIKR